MSSMLADVITSGTATGVRAAGFKLPAAGKTGTTNDYTDAWFVGYTPHLVTGVWFGLDRPAPIMNRGFASVVAVPAWAEFMTRATARDAADWFATPADVEKITICRTSGQRATDACRHGWTGTGFVQAGLTEMPGTPAGDTAVATTGRMARPRSLVYDEYFPYGTAPSGPCEQHSLAGVPGAIGTAGSVTDGGVGVVPASYTSALPGTGSRLQKVTGSDGRAVWVVR
jgi:penicillin-binding protein 1A